VLVNEGLLLIYSFTLERSFCKFRMFLYIPRNIFFNWKAFIINRHTG